MAYTILTYSYSGSNVFALNFPLGYTRPDQISVVVNSETSNRPFTFLTPGTVAVGGDPLVNGDVVKVYRTVDVEDLFHEFATGASYTAQNIDEAYKQSLMAVHQVLDGRFGSSFATALDMNGNKITNVAPGTVEGDVVTFEQLGDVEVLAGQAQTAAASALAYKTLAESAATAAAISEDACAADALAVSEALETLTLGPSQPKTQIFTAGSGFTAGVSTTVTLTVTPIPVNEDCITVDFDGVVKARDTFTYNSDTGVITFASAIGAGVAKVQVHWWTSLVIGTPAPASVSWNTHMKTSTANKIPRWNSVGAASQLDYLQEDDFASNSNVGLASQRSTKTFVTNAIADAIAGIPSGKLRQIQFAHKTDTYQTSSASFVAVPGLSVDITPTSVDSKIVVLAVCCGATSSVNGNPIIARLNKDGSGLGVGDASGGRTRGAVGCSSNGPSDTVSLTMLHIDTAGTTSEITYGVDILSAGGSNAYINRTHNDTNSAATLRGVSAIVVVELGTD